MTLNLEELERVASAMARYDPAKHNYDVVRDFKRAFKAGTNLKLLAVVKAAKDVSDKQFAGELFGHEMEALATLHTAIDEMELPL